jgi:hypothetical protein
MRVYYNSKNTVKAVALDSISILEKSCRCVKEAGGGAGKKLAKKDTHAASDVETADKILPLMWKL